MKILEEGFSFEVNKRNASSGYFTWHDPEMLGYLQFFPLTIAHMQFGIEYICKGNQSGQHMTIYLFQ